MRRDETARSSRIARRIGVALLALAALFVALPNAAGARGGFGVSIYGGGYYGYPPHYYHRPRYYYPPPYYYYYYPPPPPPAVIYVPPPPPATTTIPTPTPAVPTASQANCREYESTTTIDGRPQKIVGTACLQPDGSWRIIR